MPFLHAVSTLHFESAGGPRYMQVIGTSKIGLHITNSHIQRPRMTVNLRIGSRRPFLNRLYAKLQIKKTAYNEGHLDLHCIGP